MKVLVALFGFIFLISCPGFSMHSPPPPKPKAEQSQLKQIALEMIQQKLTEKDYVYQLTIQQQNRISLFSGKQSGLDWMIEDPKQKIKMERKGEQIFADYAGKKEEMTVKQAGLVSPKDHLAWIKEMAESFQPLADTSVNGEPVKQIEVKIDKSKLVGQLRQRVNARKDSPFFLLHTKMEIFYRLAYSAKNHKLLRMTLVILPENPVQKQELTYIF
jgi:hypothetical protein